MREIKFRAWHMLNRQYYEVNEIDFINKSCIIENEISKQDIVMEKIILDLILLIR